VLGALFLAVKQLGREADLSPPSSAKVKNDEAIAQGHLYSPHPTYTVLHPLLSFYSCNIYVNYINI
jgi:hypothetical protein